VNFVRVGKANCGHATGGLAVVHQAEWLCPPCAARHWFQDNATLICEQARRSFADGHLAETVALCLMARAVGARDCRPCRCGDRIEAVI
jgi:hypothetical protein